MTHPTHPADVRLYAALVNCTPEETIRWYPRGVENDGAKLAACHRAIMAKEVAPLLEALKFYANKENWVDTPPWDGDPETITPNAIPVSNEDGRPCDCGSIAQSALAAWEKDHAE